MLEEIFLGSKLRLLKTFLEEEAKSYSKNLSEKCLKNKTFDELSLDGLKWVDNISEKFIEEFKKKCPNGCDRMTFYSLGNSGCMDHSIQIYAKRPSWNWNKPSIEIYLCTCGNINCWGNINIVGEKPTEIYDVNSYDDQEGD
jgi:hypothetical protein